MHAAVRNTGTSCKVIAVIPLMALQSHARRLVFALCMGVISISLFSALRRFIPFYVLRQAGCPPVSRFPVVMLTYLPDTAVPFLALRRGNYACCNSRRRQAWHVKRRRAHHADDAMFEKHGL